MLLSGFPIKISYEFSMSPIFDVFIYNTVEFKSRLFRKYIYVTKFYLADLVFT
jgi:hypothetical protein